MGILGALQSVLRPLARPGKDVREARKIEGIVCTGVQEVPGVHLGGWPAC